MGLEDRAVEEDDGLGLGIGSLAEVVDVAVWRPRVAEKWIFRFEN
jgi:hypothetical protein